MPCQQIEEPCYHRRFVYDKQDGQPSPEPTTALVNFCTQPHHFIARNSGSVIPSHGSEQRVFLKQLHLSEADRGAEPPDFPRRNARHPGLRASPTTDSGTQRRPSSLWISISTTCGSALRTASTRLLHVGRAEATSLLLHLHDHVARLQPTVGRRRVRRDIGDHHALLVVRRAGTCPSCPGVIGASFSPSAGRCRSASCGRRLVAASAEASLLRRPAVRPAWPARVTSLPSRHSTTGTSLPIVGLGDDARQGVHLLHVLAVELQDDVAVADLRLVGRAAVGHAGHHRAGRRPSAPGSRRCPASPAGSARPASRGADGRIRAAARPPSWPCWTGSRSRCRSSRRTAR